jgi:peptidyl-prolyl cis-trans isomerase D
MKEGEIRGPVKTQFGYHILKLDGIQPAAQKTFEQSKSDLEVEYRNTEADREFSALQDSLQDAALQNGSDIEMVARKTKLPLKQVADFSRIDGGGDLGNAPKVLEAAFSPEVLDGHLSSIVELSKGRGVVLTASDHKMPQQKPLDAVRDQVLAAVKKQRGMEMAESAAADAAKQLAAAAAPQWDAVAKALGGTAEAPHFVGRADQAVPREVRAAAFAAARPEGKPIYQALTLANGDAAVFGLLAVREDPSAAQQDATLARQYAEEVASTESQDYAAAARLTAKVALNPQAID